MKKITFLLVLFLFACASSEAQDYPTPVEGDFIIENFEFEKGGILEKLNLHYRTIGTPKTGSDGKVNNAVLILHGTTGNGGGFLSDRFAGNLFGPGQLLDAAKYFIILTDGIGHGKSSKPSDGLRMDFPAYTYNDMVVAQYRLLTEHLKVNHLRLVMGTSMGGMHSWVWGYMYPDFMDALMPLASAPVEIAGRNRMLRMMIINSIKNDPAWNNGNYEDQPPGLTYAMHGLIFMVSSPYQWQKAAPTREKAEVFLEQKITRYASMMDANDLIYQFDASRFYNPSPHLQKIKAPLIAINSADDQVNPPELGILKEEIKKVKNGQYILLPITSETIGHSTHSKPKIWGEYLERLLQSSEEK